MCKATHRNRIRPCASFLSRGLLFTSAFILSLSSDAISAADDVESMKHEIDTLRHENADLRRRLESQADSINKLMHRLESLEQKSAAIVKGDEISSVEVDAAPDRMTVPSLKLQWFGDVNFREGGKVSGQEDLANTFSLGQLGLMANSRLSENASVMSEIVFQYKDDESSSATIERLQFQYHANDLINFRLGRMHTPLGYWNETFHHGTWFQSTILRPEILRFHDGGSVLPIHSVGLEMYGYRAVNLFDIHYSVGVANGRGQSYTATVNIQDLNNDKAVYGVLSLTPASVPGLRLGVNVYHDVIPPDSSIPTRNGEIDELITGAHLAYLRNRLELLSEGVRIEHDDAVSSKRFTSWGMYVQAGYQFGNVKPYYRFDHLDAEKDDPFYGPQVVDITRHAVGLRWDFMNWAALKFEYHYVDRNDLNRPHAFYTQAAFTY